MTVPIIVAVLVLALLLIAAVGFMVHRMKKKGERPKHKYLLISLHTFVLIAKAEQHLIPEICSK